MVASFIIVYSERDPAGKNIAQHLRGSGIEIFKVDEDIIRCDKEIEGIGAPRIIFASRHRSEKGQTSFTVHPIGNWGKAEKGGNDNTICPSLPIEMKNALISINTNSDTNKFKDNGWKICMEVTHHGPFCKVPCFFIEIGSSENEWNNKDAGKIIADSILEVTGFGEEKTIKQGGEEKDWKVCLGVGGGHYSPKFTPLILDESDSGIAFSHILPDYHAETVDFDTFKQGIVASDRKISHVLFDWKGLKKAGRERITKFSDQIGVKWEKA